MKYKITTSFNWYDTEDGRYIIKTYHINGIQFTFDDISDIMQEDSTLIDYANQNPIYTPEYFYLKSFYLMNEECHPLLFELKLENPEILEELDSQV